MYLALDKTEEIFLKAIKDRIVLRQSLTARYASYGLHLYTEAGYDIVKLYSPRLSTRIRGTCARIIEYALCKGSCKKEERKERNNYSIPHRETAISNITLCLHFKSFRRRRKMSGQITPRKETVGGAQ